MPVATYPHFGSFRCRWEAEGLQLEHKRICVRDSLSGVRVLVLMRRVCFVVVGVHVDIYISLDD